MLLTRLADAVVRSAPPDFRTAVVEVAAAGATTEVTASAEVADGAATTQFRLEMDGEIACAELRKEMFQPGKGTWYRARFTVDSARRIDAEFDYTNAPFGEDLDQATVDMLNDDQRRFPRDRAHLPDWHPSHHEQDA